MYDKTMVFQNIGIAIKKFNQITEYQRQLDSLMSEFVALYNDSAGERRILNLFSNANRSDQAALDSIKSQTISIISSFLTSVVREDLSIVGSITAVVIEALIKKMQASEDCVKCNAVRTTVPIADSDNEGQGKLQILEATQQARDDNDFEVVCIDATTMGEEHWSIVSSKLGSLGTAITGQEFESNKAGIKLKMLSAKEDKFVGDEEGGHYEGTFAVGDKFYFSTSIGDKGLFQYFFVQQFGQALPTRPDNQNSVPDVWAR